LYRYTLESLTRTPPKTIKPLLLPLLSVHLPAAFLSLEAVRGDVVISRNDGLRIIDGVFRKLMYVAGEVRVVGLYKLNQVAS
jgi:hypothetical protein